MDIRTVDLGDAQALRAWHRSGLEAHRHDRPGAPFWTEDEVVHVLRPDDPEERFVPLVAVDGDRVVGSAILFVPLLENRDKAYVALTVAPDRRGTGVGDALVEEVLRVGEAEKRALLVAEGHVPVDAGDDHPVHRFAARHGFTVGNTEVRRTLELPVPVERLDAWAAEAAAHHEGYELHSFVDQVPPELRPSMVELLNQLVVDAPTGEIDFEAGAMTVEIYEEQSARRIATGRTSLITVAVKDGQTVAQTTLSVPPGDSELPHLQQWGTFVHRDHRGHRLGLAVKVANQRWVQQRNPERTLVHTSNSPVNGPMVAVNELLGFRPVEVNVEYVRHL